MASTPETRYALSAGNHIAYQVADGSGRDILYLRPDDDVTSYSARTSRASAASSSRRRATERSPPSMGRRARSTAPVG